jgi:hypothetical protein
MTAIVGVLFFAVFFGLIAVAVVSTGKKRKMWSARPAVLRALAARRGYQFVENPGKPSELTPIRPADKETSTDKFELPSAVKGRTLDGTFTMFDLYRETRTRTPGSTVHWNTLIRYETFITIRNETKRWPHFEFAVVAHVAPDSISGKLLAMTNSLAAGIMESSRGLKRVLLPEQPGSQLYVENPDSPQASALRDTLSTLFAQRSGWWLGALDDSLTIQKSVNAKSPEMPDFVPAEQLDPFIDESLEIERALRKVIG